MSPCGEEALGTWSRVDSTRFVPAVIVDICPVCCCAPEAATWAALLHGRMIKTCNFLLGRLREYSVVDAVRIVLTR